MTFRADIEARTSWVVRGSNDFLGFTWTTTSLRQSSTGTWEHVLGC